MFINVNVATMGARKTITVDTETATPQSCFEEAGIDYSSASPSLNGITLRAGDMGATLAALNVTRDANLTAIVKADSAVA
jgi:hypothetical protein